MNARQTLMSVVCSKVVSLSVVELLTSIRHLQSRWHGGSQGQGNIVCNARGRMRMRSENADCGVLARSLGSELVDAFCFHKL